MSLLETVPVVSAVIMFSQLRIGGSALTQAFNDSKLGYALGEMFNGPHAKLYTMPNRDRVYIAHDAKQPAPEGAEYAGKVVFFTNPRNPDAAYSIRQSVEEIEDGTLGTSYAVFANAQKRDGKCRTSSPIMTISGAWPNGAGVRSSLKNVQFTDAQGVSGYNWQGLVILDRLLKSRPLARNPLWTAPKP